MTSHGQEKTLSYLRQHFLGPKFGEEELLEANPVYAHLSGMIFPIEQGEGIAPDDLDEEITEDNLVESFDVSQLESLEETEEEDIGNLTAATGWTPSSMGLSFIHESDELLVHASGARYERSPAGSDDEADDAKKEGWQRIPLTQSPVRIVAGTSGSELIWNGLAKIQWRSRPSLELPVMTVAISNVSTSELGRAKKDIEKVLFQVGMTVETTDGRFLPYPGGSVVNATPEDRELSFRFRNHKSYAIGHGVAATWAQTEPVKSISTDSLPTEVVRPVKPRNSNSESLSMSYLGSDHVPTTELCSGLRTFFDDYKHWIFDQESQIKGVSVTDEATARSIVERQQAALSRIHEGIDLLESDPTVLSAFRLANLAMQKQGKSTKNPQPAWRPFQLAFILLSLPSTADTTHEHRDLVDLIWFPTGGGKTEAYLGLAAFEMIRRRLVHGYNGGGTAVLTRYTMRLLTAQQFQRTARLICALELMRESGQPLSGMAPFSIGLLLGNSTTPGTFKEAEKQLERLRDELSPQSPFQVRVCPWCSTSLTPPRRSTDLSSYGFEATRAHFKIRCVKPECPFSEKLPIQVVDEAIYQDPPSIVVATVDKLARLAWTPHGGSIFGLDDSPYIPPSLVIQDELHLIAGPLGTIVGIYEAAIRSLLSWRGQNPKIVASTATIRTADDQVRSLFASDVSVFPPSGLDADDNYFATIDNESPGRLYIGLMPQAFTQAWAVGQTAGRLLSAPDAISLTPEERDAYWTLVLYHNSLRELGRTVTILRDDVRDNLARAKEQRDSNREISSDGVFELTSNVSSHELVEILERLEIPADADGQIDALVATNILSVGIDVSRLGLMLVNGQPKTTSEYIQATSRVGRGQIPGMVLTLYRAGKARDRSTYESFRTYHGSFYRFVEPTSVTPWTMQARRRATRAALVILVRQAIGLNRNEDAAKFRSDSAAVKKAINLLMRFIRISDPDEADEVEKELSSAAIDWSHRAENSITSLKYDSKHEEERLLKSFGDVGAGWPTMHSMRSVDKSVRVRPRGEQQ